MQFIPPEATLPAGALQLQNITDVLTQGEAVRRHPWVVLHFPKWTDGRAYSQAHLLRARLGFAGRIVATGEVLADMLPLLQRCGFDAVQLQAGQCEATARRALGFFDAHYQALAAERATIAEGTAR